MCRRRSSIGCPPATERISSPASSSSWTRRAGSYSRPPAFESGGGGLVSTVDDMLAFGQMMLAKGAYGRERILSRPSVELMTMDHLTAGQKAASPFFQDFWDTRGWGFGVGVVTGRNDIADVPGRFGWDGAFGTSWWVDPTGGVGGCAHDPAPAGCAGYSRVHSRLLDLGLPVDRRLRPHRKRIDAVPRFST